MAAVEEALIKKLEDLGEKRARGKKLHEWTKKEAAEVLCHLFSLYDSSWAWDVRSQSDGKNGKTIARYLRLMDIGYLLKQPSDLDPAKHKLGRIMGAVLEKLESRLGASLYQKQRQAVKHRRLQELQQRRRHNSAGSECEMDKENSPVRQNKSVTTSSTPTKGSKSLSKEPAKPAHSGTESKPPAAKRAAATPVNTKQLKLVGGTPLPRGSAFRGKEIPRSPPDGQTDELTPPPETQGLTPNVTREKKPSCTKPSGIIMRKVQEAKVTPEGETWNGANDILKKDRRDSETPTGRRKTRTPRSARRGTYTLSSAPLGVEPEETPVSIPQGTEIPRSPFVHSAADNSHADPQRPTVSHDDVIKERVYSHDGSSNNMYTSVGTSRTDTEMTYNLTNKVHKDVDTSCADADGPQKRMSLEDEKWRRLVDQSPPVQGSRSQRDSVVIRLEEELDMAADCKEDNRYPSGVPGFPSAGSSVHPPTRPEDSERTIAWGPKVQRTGPAAAEDKENSQTQANVPKKRNLQEELISFSGFRSLAERNRCTPMRKTKPDIQVQPPTSVSKPKSHLTTTSDLSSDLPTMLSKMTIAATPRSKHLNAVGLPSFAAGTPAGKQQLSFGTPSLRATPMAKATPMSKAAPLARATPLAKAAPLAIATPLAKATPLGLSRQWGPSAENTITNFGSAFRSKGCENKPTNREKEKPTRGPVIKQSLFPSSQNEAQPSGAPGQDRSGAAVTSLSRDLKFCHLKKRVELQRRHEAILKKFDL
ncbi:uncharacterized protein LOC144885584 [Branchiostoma floridae x Branchiostoma japonicum]